MTHPAKYHPDNAKQFVADGARTGWHDRALWFVRAKRDKMARSVPEWESLRRAACEIKAHSVANLAEYLEQFERNATRQGAVVHWARDAAEHNAIVLEILQDRRATRVVKSKSMLTEECGLNPVLEAAGIEVVDTDLGERIVQFRGEVPSHIVLPAIHLKKEDVGETFHEHLGTDRGASDPKYLTEAARGHLREKFMAADAGITGVNMACAESGGVVVCTNEGNADLGASLPKLHVACMGIEKIVPTVRDLAVFTRMLARSATGQPVTTYTSHFHGPIAGGELHIVLVDNGRSKLLAGGRLQRVLRCIRCAACMNTCPVYRRSGGHSYGVTVPGPIGSVLAPARDAAAHRSLPYACSLCGSCADVCPVCIDLDEQLYYLRQDVAARGLLPLSKRAMMKVAGIVFRRPWLYALAGKVARWIVPKLPRFLLYNRLNAWGNARELPEMPKHSFRELYQKRREGHDK